MRMRTARSENGQTLLLFMLGMVGMLAFVALALDGGMILFDRRSAQNAADQAALAGAYEMARNPWDTSTLSSRIQTAANSRAHDNHYGTLDGKTVVVSYPPASGSVNFVAGDTNLSHYIQVTITSSVNTSFMHFVYNGPVYNTVEAVAHVIPPPKKSPFNGSGLVSLAPSGCKGTQLGGNLIVNLVGGGMFVNSNDPSCALFGNSGGNLLYTPSLTVVGGISSNITLYVVPGPINSPAPSASMQYPPTYMPAMPDCSSAPNSTKKANNKTVNGITYDEYSPGKLSGFPSGNVYFDPGLYCITINNLGGTNINNNQHVYNDPNDHQGVLIVLTGSNPCSLNVTGTPTIQLKGVGADSPYASTYQGLLMYVDPGNFTQLDAGPLSFAGSQTSYISGTIYAPTCHIIMNGNGGNFYQGQIIGYTENLTGNATIGLQYVPGDNLKVQMPAKVDLTQ